MLTHPEQRTWTSLGWGSGESHVSIATSGQLGGIILAWKEAIFDRSETWLGQHVVAARLVNRIDGAAIVMALVYGPSAPSLQCELLVDLVQLCGAFTETPLLIGGDFNVTLMADDRPNRAGGKCLGSVSPVGARGDGALRP